MIPLHNFTPLPGDLIEAQVDEMHAVCAPTLAEWSRDPAAWWTGVRAEKDRRFADHDARQRAKQEARWALEGDDA